MGIIFMLPLVGVFLIGALTIVAIIIMDKEHKQRMKEIDERYEKIKNRGFRYG